MESTDWVRVEGMIIARALDPQKMAEYLASRAVVAQLEWFAKTPQMMGIRVALSEDRVAALPKGATQVTPGSTLIDLIEGLAEEFHAEVMIADMGIDRLDEVPLPEDDQDEDATSEPLRVVEIGNTPASAVPLFAAFEGIDIADLELPNGKRVLLAELPADRVGWSFGDLPLVTLTAQGNEFQVFLIEDDDPETFITHNWGMEELTVAGQNEPNTQAVQIAQDLVGGRSDVEAIHDAVPGVNLNLAYRSLGQKGQLAIDSFVAALGLPAGVAQFLGGSRSVSDVEGTNLHEARGISNAIGRSVDIMISERGGATSLWEAYTSMVVNKPWLVPMVASAEAAIAGTLLTVSRGKGKPRTTAKKWGTFFGVVLLIDSVAEVSLAKLVQLRAERHAEQGTDLYEL